ncbi:helicase-related protein [Sphingomonas sp. Leaf25]|uniref:helicase-related protein n=1 Tax=Sphingomonas sp. Leaf25 TaxID=1735692 RepID=UPI0006F602D7|nr:helicase-related protein [Sphingomonas sp. Leaf25]KQN00310.1 DEAD/DEAH box helicase [Sphingomonas sp. Leaf25]
MLQAPIDAAVRTAVPSPEVVSAALADALATRSVLFVAADEGRAARVAALLAAFVPEGEVVHLPASDALPGDDAPASPANAGARVAALRRLRVASAGGRSVACITTPEATALRVAPPAAFDAAPPVLRAGDAIDMGGFADRAVELGYVIDDRVDEPGEVAVRGGVIDLFPADAAGPVRITIEDDRIVAIRRYDPVTQRSDADLDAIVIGRAAEPVVADGVPLTDHLPDAAIVSDAQVGERRQRFLDLARDATHRRRRDDATLVDGAGWDAAVAARERIELPPAGDCPPRFVTGNAPARAFGRFARGVLADGRLVLAGSPRDLRFFAPRLATLGRTDPVMIGSWVEAAQAKPGSAMLLTAPVDRGFVADGVTVVAGGDLLGGRARGDELAVSNEALFAEGGELRIGDVVVHEDFGIGRITGLEALPGEEGGDAIVLDYARDARRLVPVAEADRIWRYGAEGDGVTLDALDGTSWQKRRGAIDAAIAESARELAAIAAERDARQVPPIEAEVAAYERFAAGFAFTETPDQARAIAAVRADLASGRPMDRLVIGDVGYGKTEVALRAAAIVALAGRQVAIAAPTTVLVRQHLDSFTRRFAGTGIAVAGLSRLSSATEKKRVKAGLADGSIGVVIGTQALAGKGVAYADLALTVIDEEQRFGAADKAKLRALSDHVMTLSATPIPRTLQSAMIGLQQLSVIATPPARRQPIRTTLGVFDDTTVRTALLRERSRGGQSFVVVPRIEDIAALEERLRRLAPELGVVVAHGRMAAAEIDEAMVGFAQGDGDVLLATNIIEAGLDVPRANTMIVHHADRFGLSQLHQLRGRVGRGGRRGQVLLTTEPDRQVGEATMQRLRTLQAFDRLGAGFAISARDLDLRGAGDLVGEAQAGHMKLIGIDLYQFLLTRALRAVRGETVSRWVPEVHLGLAGCLPEIWIPEAEVRLTLYGRLARIGEEGALDAYEEELADRFGALPGEVQRLIDLKRVQLLACAAGIARIDAGPAAIALTPHGKAAMPEAAGLAGKNGRWILAERIDDPADRLARVQEVLAEIAG